MKTNTQEPFQEKQSIELAIGCFVVSTLLFVLYIGANQSPDILIIGAPFIGSAIVLNLIMVFHLLEKFIHLAQYRKDIAVKILVLLSNIPITFLYYLIIMKL